MKIVIIGSGNVSFHLAKAFKESNITVEKIVGRNVMALKEISDKTGFNFSTEIPQDADFYLIAVNDDAIAEISKKILNENAIVAHTSGSVSREALHGSYRKSVFYPLQTFSKSKNLEYSEIPFFIDAEHEETQQILMRLAEKISSRVMIADDEKRKYIHLTAVFCCNFVNHLFARAKEIADEQKIPFAYFLPLIDETAQKIHTLEPKLAQTGPAIRKDNRVLQLHEALITDEEKKLIYTIMNESIKKMYE